MKSRRPRHRPPRPIKTPAVRRLVTNARAFILVSGRYDFDAAEQWHRLVANSVSADERHGHYYPLRQCADASAMPCPLPRSFAICHAISTPAMAFACTRKPSGRDIRRNRYASADLRHAPSSADMVMGQIFYSTHHASLSRHCLFASFYHNIRCAFFASHMACSSILFIISYHKKSFMLLHTRARAIVMRRPSRRCHPRPPSIMPPAPTNDEIHRRRWQISFTN